MVLPVGGRKPGIPDRTGFELNTIVNRLDPGSAGSTGQFVRYRSGSPTLVDGPIFDIEDYGANPDGSGDNTAAVIAAMDAANAAGGGTVWLPHPVDYLCETVSSGGGLVWIIPVAQDNITFAGVPGSGLKTTQNAALIHINGGGKPAGMASWSSYWLHGGNTNPTTPLHDMAPASEGDMAITLDDPSDAADYAPGDIIYIRTGATLNIDGSIQPKAELNEVVAVETDTGIITLRWSLCRDYDVENLPSNHAGSGTPAPFGCANVTDRVLRNVTFRGIRLISAYDDGRAMVPEGGVIGLTFEDVYVESGSSFQSLNNVRRGRYRGCNVHLNGTSPTRTYWWFSTATGTNDVIIEDFDCTAVGLGNFHIHEGSTNIVVRDGIARTGGNETADHVVSVRAHSKNVTIDNVKIFGLASGVGSSSIFVDDTCEGGVIDRVQADGPVNIGAPGYHVGLIDTPGSISFYNHASGAGGHIANGLGPTPMYQISGWVSDSVHTQVLGVIPNRTYIANVRVHVTQGFNSDGDDTIQVGTADTANHYADGIDVSSTGIKSVTPTNAGYQSSRRVVQAKYVAGGSNPTAGKALVIVEYYHVAREVA